MLAIVLALVSAACSGSARDEAAPRDLDYPLGEKTDATTTSSGLSAAPNGGEAAGGTYAAVPASEPGKGTSTGRQAVGTTSTTHGSGPSATTTTLTRGLPPERCPDAKTCRRYAHSGNPNVWPAGPGGRARIEYWINPSGAVGIRAEEIEGAVKAAFGTWDSAVPTLHHIYMGRTSRVAVSGDGFNVIDFNAPVPEYTFASTTPDGRPEFDITFSPSGWIWRPCEQRDGSCTPAPDSCGQGCTQGLELQSIATHAAGHTLWLADMDDKALDRELTMSPDIQSHPTGARHWSTLALGDVLGARALYPCSCPLPPIYTP